MDTTDSSHSKGLRLAAAGVALAAIAMAAGCGSSKSSGTKAAAATSSAASTGSSGAVDGGASPSAAGSASAGSASATASSLPPKPTDPGAGGPHDCSTDMLSFKIDTLREPINHVMISAKNTSKLPCHLDKYPLLRISLTQTTTIKAADATKPAGPILLAPGATAYAGIMTNAADGSGAAGKNVPALELQLQPGSGAGGVGRPVSVQMPATAQYIDSSAVVSYWESDIQTAAY